MKEQVRRFAAQAEFFTPQEVQPSDVVLIPPSCRQRITNVGQRDLVFLAICTPRFVQDAYQEL